MRQNKLYYIANFLNIFASIIGVAIPVFIQRYIDTFSFSTQSNLGIYWILGLFVGQTLIQMGASYGLSVVAEEFIQNWHLKICNALLRGKLAHVKQLESVQTATYIVNGTEEVKKYYTTVLPSFVSAVITIVVALVILVRLDWQLSLVLFLALLFLALVSIPMSNLNRRNMENVQNTTSQFSSSVAEMLRELEMVKANNLENYELNLFKEHTQKRKAANLKLDLIDSLTTPFMLSIIFLTIAIVFIYGGVRIVQGTLSVGVLVSFIVYLFQLLNPFSAATSFFGHRAKYLVIEKKMAEYLSIESELVEGLQIEQNQLEAVHFDKVSFQYEERPILKNIQLELPIGGKIALVGPSGSGKTTLIRLLLRFYEAAEGNIKFGTHNIETLALHEWRQLFAYVGQSGGIINGTIRENLIAGLDTEPTDERLDSALSYAHLQHDILLWPMGLETQVGENGENLSGGQRQRLQLARAFLKQASFVILDEATSNLDADSEQVINQALNRLRGSATIIMIAHRLSTVVDADIIYFIEAGEVTGMGNHRDLYESHTNYRRYIDEQMII